MKDQEKIILTGRFYDGLFHGLEYVTQTISGTTNEKGEFRYREGETITFTVGELILGSALADRHLTPAHLIIEVDGNVKKIKNQKVTNITRFLLSLSESYHVEKIINITEEIKNIVNKYRYNIRFDQPESDFTDDPNIQSLFSDLKLLLKTGPQSRNHLRRTLFSIRKITDVKIPLSDGAFLVADVFRPSEEGKYPVIMSLGPYCKDCFFGTPVKNEEDVFVQEKKEDNYFEGNPDPFDSTGVQISERHELANTADWVPNGYVVIRVDSRGSGKSPGLFQQFSIQEARDYYDAIEWAAKQSWSNGNIGLFGSSYYAMTQYNVAQLQPPSLKAMIPVAGDINSYRDYIYTGGGLFNKFNHVTKFSSLECEAVDWLKIAMENPFDEPEIYGPEGKICISPDMSKVVTPFHSGVTIECPIHTRGSSEAYILAASEHKKLTVICDPPAHGWNYVERYLKDDMDFFDHWLKGIDNGIMDRPPVSVMVRTGWGGHYWLREEDWPIPRTSYTKFYLDASPSDWKGDKKNKEFMKIVNSIPLNENDATYSGDVIVGNPPSQGTSPSMPWKGDFPDWNNGASFITEPLAEDVVIAGYIKLSLWVSSNTYDMQIHAVIRVIDENEHDVSYSAGDPASKGAFPIGHGALKVSHRKLDPGKSTIYRPYHTHRKEDYQPLSPGEIVEAQIEIWPTTALIKKGYRIKLNIKPGSGEGTGKHESDPIDSKYRKGSLNTIYTGPDHPSYIQLPIITPKE